tara:strand:- start:473 stop:1528 length:1056 start_codon:yes stop_codon:yes gene_type:complete
MSLPPAEIPQGALRFNTDSQRLEFYAQGEWWKVSTDTPNLATAGDESPGTRALFAGGYSPSPVLYSRTTDVINIATTGNGKNFGDLTDDVVAGGGVGSRTRALFCGGYTPAGGRAQIDFHTFSTEGTAADFGDLNNGASARKAAVGNQTRGLWAGGDSSQAQIDVVAIATLGQIAADFGDLTVGRSRFAAAGNVTRGIFVGGFTPSPNTYHNVIDYVHISSSGSAMDFGDLLVGKSWTSAAANPTRMLIGGGYSHPLAVSEMDYLTIASKGNATFFGDLNKVVDTGTYANSGAASATRGVFNTGLFTNPTATYHDTIYYHEIATLGKAADFGDLQEPNYGCKTCSNGHGGL